MSFFGATPETGAPVSTSTTAASGAFFGSPAASGSGFTGGKPSIGAPVEPTAPKMGEPLVGPEGAGGSAYFASGLGPTFSFDFTSMDGLSFLGQFSLIPLGSSGFPVDDLDGEERDFGLLQSRGSTAAEIEVFLGLDPGTLDSLTDRTPTNGAVVKLTFPDTVGLDLIEFEWNFLETEGGSTFFDDFAFFVTSDGQTGVLSSSSMVGGSGSTGWTVNEIMDFPDGAPEWIAFGVVNVTDTLADAYLGIDQVDLVGVDVATSGKAVGSAFFGFDMV